MSKLAALAAISCLAFAPIAKADVSLPAPATLNFGQPVFCVNPVTLATEDCVSPVAAPSSAATAAIVPCVSNAASTLQCKASPGNFYTAYVTATANSWLYVFNTTTTPVNGAVTAGTASGNYQDCIAITSGTSGSVGGLLIPERFSVGIYFALSSTACGTLTLATTGAMHGEAQ